MNKEKRFSIKKKCRQMEVMIRNSPLDEESIKDIINQELRQHFGTLEHKSMLDNTLINHYFEVNGWACDSDLYSHNRIIFINFHKRREPISKTPHRGTFIENPGRVIKRLSFANFVFKHCNPIGLILLEKIMFQLA